MTWRSNDRAFWLLRRGDQAVVALALLLCLIGSITWWTVEGGRGGELVDVDKAETRVYSFKVDINRAGWPELAQLPGIGEVTARKIIASRKSKGPFHRIDDLQRIRGIGPKKVKSIRPYLLPVEKLP
jgi:competence protein ComEA